MSYAVPVPSPSPRPNHGCRSRTCCAHPLPPYLPSTAQAAIRACHQRNHRCSFQIWRAYLPRSQLEVEHTAAHASTRPRPTTTSVCSDDSKHSAFTCCCCHRPNSVGGETNPRSRQVLQLIVMISSLSLPHCKHAPSQPFATFLQSGPSSRVRTSSIMCEILSSPQQLSAHNARPSRLSPFPQLPRLHHHHCPRQHHTARAPHSALLLSSRVCDCYQNCSRGFRCVALPTLARKRCVPASPSPCRRRVLSPFCSPSRCPRYRRPHVPSSLT